MEHPWLEGVDWKKISEKKVKAAFLPERGDNFDSRQVLAGWRDVGEDVVLEDSGWESLFVGYYYDGVQSDETILTVKL